MRVVFKDRLSSAISHGSGFNVLKVLNSRIFRDGDVDAERRREEVGIRNIAKVLTLTGGATPYAFLHIVDIQSGKPALV